jgi:hypothetical protein
LLYSDTNQEGDEYEAGDEICEESDDVGFTFASYSVTSDEDGVRKVVARGNLKGSKVAFKA